MNIIVAGCGKIGSALIASLSTEGHDVTVIDKDPMVLSTLNNQFDVIGVCGNAAACDTLTEARVENVPLFIAVTGSDELNMLACFLAKKLGAQHTVARIRNPEYSSSSQDFMRSQLDITMVINPEKLAAQELFNTLKFPSTMKLETFSRRNFGMIELRLKEDSPLCDMPLSSLRSRIRADFLIGAVQRGEEVYIPTGDFVLKSGDKVELTAKPSELHKLLKTMGLLKKQARNIMILGGSKTAFYLTRMLLNSGSAVTVIDRDRDVCRDLNEAMPDAMVIHGDGSQESLLVEEGLRSQDAFVALTGMDEQNILMSFFAASQQIPKVVAKINRDELGAIAERMGLDSLISLRHIVANILVKYVRALDNSGGSDNIETLYRLMDGKVEALEFIVDGPSVLTGKPLKALKFKHNILIAGILRDRSPLIPNGDDVILPGDSVVVLAAGHRLQSLTDILK